MSQNMLVRWASAIALALIAVYLIASTYFCSDAVEGGFGSCVRLTGESFVRSPSALIIAVAAAVSLAICHPRR